MEFKHFSRKYLREELLPSAFCAGCGLGTVTNCFLKAVEELGHEDLKEFVFCTGIGCSAWIPSPYFKADSIHATHGRSVAVATGVKLVRPELHVVVFGGDGDLMGIGLNHTVQAARRNLEITVILVNNMVYAMTRGQVAPTTPVGVKTSTTPYGNVEYPINAAELMAVAGASYVARWTTVHPVRLKNSIKKALTTEGFAFIEVVSQCPTYYGRRVGFENAVDMIKWLRKNSVSIKRKKPGKIGVGELVVTRKPGLVALIQKVRMETVKGEEE